MSLLRPTLFAIIAMAATAIRAADTTENLAQRVAVEQAMRRAADYAMTHLDVGSSVWNRGAYHAGNFRAYQYLGLTVYRDYSISWAEANSWLVGPEAGGGSDADSQACGQTYVDLYRLDPQPVRIASIRGRLDLLVNSSSSADDWWWIDAFFMAGPTLARMGVVQDDAAYLDQLDTMYRYMRDNYALYDSAYGLWYRDNTAKSRTGANTPEFWGRGNGWVIAACARILETLPAGDPRRGEFATMLQTMAAALLPLQGSDGFWRSNLLFPNQYPNPETSSTAFFTYAITYGINQGLLDRATYEPAVLAAWNGLCTTALHSDGFLGYVQAIGAAPGSANYNGQQDYGYGAFLLAGSEILRLLGGPAPVSAYAGPDVRMVDEAGNYAASLTLDASGSVLRGGTVTRTTWWSGGTLLGEGTTLPIVLGRGAYDITLQIEQADGGIYTDSLTATVAAPPPTVTATGNQVGNGPANTLDGSLDTRWSQEGDNQWIRYELAAPLVLDHVGIAFYSGNARLSYFDLQLSLDGSSWTTVYSGASSGTTLELETFSFPARETRFVRYVGHGNSVSDWNSLTEFDIPVPGDQTDEDGDTLPDSWELYRTGTTGLGASADPAGVGVSLRTAYVLGLPAGVAESSAPLLTLTPGSGGTIVAKLDARAAFGPGYGGLTRKLRVLTGTTLAPDSWTTVPGFEEVTGNNVPRTFDLAPGEAHRFFRVEAWLE